MTCIAWDGKVLASEGRITSEDSIITDSFNKIHRLKNAKYMDDPLLAIGMSGVISDALKLIEYLNSTDFLLQPISHKIHALIVGKYYLYELNHNDSHMIRYHKSQKLAVGSGEPWALSAMSLGLNSVQAVKHAIKHSVYCGGKIRTWSEIDPKRKIK